MTDRAAPNPPSRDLGATAAFCGARGLSVALRDEGWMIPRRGALALESRPEPGLDPLASRFPCWLRLDDLDAFRARSPPAGLPEAAQGEPRLHPPRREASGGRTGALVDPDGTPTRLISGAGRPAFPCPPPSRISPPQPAPGRPRQG